MGFEVVYCFKCQKRLSEKDFQKGNAFRVGITTTCKKCSPELIATLPAGQQAALLAGEPQKQATPAPERSDKSRKTDSDRLKPPPAPHAHRHAQVTHTKRAIAEQSSGSPAVVIGIGAAVIVGLVLLMTAGSGRNGRNNGHRVASSSSSEAVPAPKADPAATNQPAQDPPGGITSVVPDGNPRRAQEAEAALKSAREYRKANPDDLAEIVKRFEKAMWDAEKTPHFEAAKREYEESSRKLAASAPPPPAPTSPPTPPESASSSGDTAAPETPPVPVDPAPPGKDDGVKVASSSGKEPEPVVDPVAHADPATPTKDPIGWWRFDEDDGETAEDASGRGHTARLVGTVKRTLGKFGRGVKFSGDGGHVELPSTPDLDRVQAGSYTLAAWFRSEAVPEAGIPSLERFAVLVKAGRHLGIAYNHEQRFVAEHWPAEGGPILAGAWDTACPPWSFHHFAVVVDREAGEMRAYLDGERTFVKPLPKQAGAADYGTTPWRIGIADPGEGGRRWAAKGVVDDVRIYGCALDADEVTAVFKGPPPEVVSPVPTKPDPVSVPPAVAPVPDPVPNPEPKPKLAVVRLVLVDASKAQDLVVLKDGVTIKLSVLRTRKLTVRADTSPKQVGSVILELSGRKPQKESKHPYTLFGDDGGKHKAGKLEAGEHTITATPFTEEDGKGEAGQPLTIRFRMVD